MPFIDFERIGRIAEVIRSADLSSYRFDIYDSRYYPPRDEPLDKVLMYFLVMVAMDHRLSRPGRAYEAVIDGERVKGADLLYRLGMKMFREGPEFFTPQRLANVTGEDVLRWLSIGTASPPDPDLRAFLLRDLGQKILRLFDGDPLKVLELSGNRIRGFNTYGLVDLLKVFKAYQDPVEKKPYLLIKFLIYRGLFKPVDPENLHVPVDNHLTRTAIRLGIVRLEDELFKKVLNGVEVTHDEDVTIRMSVREAYKALSRESNVDALLLDDFLWTFGRKVCLQDNPRCEQCIFRNVCRAYESKVFAPDLNYYNTWYY